MHVHPICFHLPAESLTSAACLPTISAMKWGHFVQAPQRIWRTLRDTAHRQKAASKTTPVCPTQKRTVVPIRLFNHVQQQNAHIEKGLFVNFRNTYHHSHQSTAFPVNENFKRDICLGGDTSCPPFGHKWCDYSK